ncbi:MAG TPA: hydroxymethylglutaryl-CoA reductase [Candidatus Acidoferrales bacterium]|nr:hydroxymethylglutaryl-CoA reductase [Candidatus Acidoferrales bacterium]
MIPAALLNSLYTVGSLKNTDGSFDFAIKNRLADAEVVGVSGIAIDGRQVAMDHVSLDLEDGRRLASFDVSAANPIPFPLRCTVKVHAGGQSLRLTRHKIEIAFEARPFGKLKLDVEDGVAEDGQGSRSIPRAEDDDYSPEIIGRRRAFIEAESGVALKHIVHHSLDPHAAKGNCENFIGVAQVPIGLAGPLHMVGEHAQGDFLIPLATSEGTLVASYNRGIKVLNLCGGVKVTVVGDAMQRAPAFVFQDARAGRDFEQWVHANLAPIRQAAEATSSVARLQYIDTFLASKFVYLRFNFSTGDAAGQNMVGRATLAACQWIQEHHPGIVKFYLEANFATDKKASDINRLRTRGKRVTAEAVIGRDILKRHMRIEPEQLTYHHGVSNVGAFLSGANNNGAQSANGIAAMFIATGQDAANIAESSAAVLYTEVTGQGDLYISLTIPSLIVATHGGGTSLATQRECLEILQCYGRGKVNRLAEIVGGVALAGEISLGAAISAADWVSSHEKLGRNR